MAWHGVGGTVAPERLKIFEIVALRKEKRVVSGSGVVGGATLSQD